MSDVTYGEWTDYPRAYDIRVMGGKHYLFVGAVDRLTAKRKGEIVRRVIADNGMSDTLKGDDAWAANMFDRTPFIRRDALRVRKMHVPDGPHARTVLDYRDDHGMGEFPYTLVIVTVV